MTRSLASEKLEEILPAASSGRVGVLFVCTNNGHSGKLATDSKVINADHGVNGAEDLIDRAAIETLRTNGQIVVVKPDEMPGKGELAAIYRC